MFTSFSEKYFDNNKVISGSDRLSALDLTRCLAMLLMIQGHCLDMLTSPAQLDLNVFPWNIWNIIRGFTAPIFLMISGIVQVFANKREADGHISLKMFLHRCRTCMLILFTGYLLVFPASRIYDVFYMDYNYFINFFQVNILQIISVSLFFSILLFTITRTDRTLGIIAFIIGISIFFLTPIIYLINWYSILPEYLAAYFTTERGSVFTIFPFTGFLFIGISVGAVLKTVTKDKRNEFIAKYAWIPGFVFFVIGMIISQSFDELPLHWKELLLRTNPGVSLFRVGVVLVFMTLSFRVFLVTQKYSKYFSLFGKKALFIYVIHLLILFGSPWFPGLSSLAYKSMDLVPAIILTIMILTITLSSVLLLDISISRFPKARTIYRFSITTSLLFFLFI